MYYCLLCWSRPACWPESNIHRPIQSTGDGQAYVAISAQTLQQKFDSEAQHSMMAGIPSCMPKVGDCSTSFVTEYHYLHEGRPPALLSFLCHRQTQLTSYNGGPYHGPWGKNSWSICGSVLNVAFHWKGNVSKTKDMSFIEGSHGRLRALPPNQMITMTPSRSWSFDGNAFEEVQPGSGTQPQESQWDWTKTSQELFSQTENAQV